MNTNCSKCGNPLQPGTSICPVCGTNNISATPAPAAAPAPAATPAAPAPVVEGQTPAPVDANATQQTPAAPLAPEAPAIPGAVPVLTPDAAQPAQDTTVAPATPEAPAAPATPAAPAIPTANGVVPPAPAPDGKKGGSKKTIIIIAVVAVVLIAVGLVVFFILNGNSNGGGGSETPPANENANVNPPVAAGGTVAANFNDYDFEVPKGWRVTEESGVLTLYDNDETVVVMLESISFGDYTEDIQKEDIQQKLEGLGYSSVVVEESSVNNNNAYVVKAKMNELSYSFAFYYIFTSSKDLVVVSVVFTDTNAESKNSNTVDKFIKSIKYKESEHAFSEAGTFSEHLENAKDGITGGAKDPIDDPFDDPFADF